MAAVLVAQAPSTAQQTPSCSMAQDGDLGIDSSLLYESFTDAVAHCAAGAYLSLQAFVHACKSPVVIDTVRKTSKTVIITAVCHYVLLTVVLWPLRLLCRLLSLLTLFIVNLDTNALLSSSMAVYPMLTIMLIKYVYRSSMEECFSHTLAQLDPKFAAQLAAKPRKYRSSMTEKLLAQLGITSEDSEDFKTMLLLMLVGMLLRSWRAVPYVGWLVGPVVQFLSIRYMVGRPSAAIVLSVLAGLTPWLEAAVMNFVQLWASSKVLGKSSMRYFMERSVPRGKRAAFIKTFEYTFVSYFLLPTALMRVPVLGSLVAFPGAAMGAYALKDILSRKAGLREALEHLN